MLEPPQFAGSSPSVGEPASEDAGEVEFWKNRPGVTLPGRVGCSGVAGSVAMSANQADADEIR